MIKTEKVAWTRKNNNNVQNICSEREGKREHVGPRLVERGKGRLESAPLGKRNFKKHAESKGCGRGWTFGA